MAEKSSELNLDTDETRESENLLEIPNKNRSLAETDDYDIDVSETTEADDAQEIRGQIEETRAKMSETIDAIQEKLSVNNITEQVKEQVVEQLGGAVETVKGAFYEKTNDLAKTIGRGLAQVGSSDLALKAKKSPWIFSAVGMGVGAILVSVLAGSQRSKRKSSYRREEFDVPQTRQQFDSGSTEDILFQVPKNESQSSNQTTSGASEKRSDSTFSNVRETAGTVYKSISSAADKTYRTVGKASGYTYRKAGDFGGSAVENYQYYIEENPLAIGAVALAIGAAIGYSIPLTRTENEYFGEVRDKIFDSAQTSVKETIDSVKQTFEDARQIIAEEVKSKTAAR